MNRTRDEFDTLLLSLAVSPDEAALQNALQEKIQAKVASVFEENDTSKNLNEFWHG
jgi:hypothetical protein